MRPWTSTLAGFLIASLGATANADPESARTVRAEAAAVSAALEPTLGLDEVLSAVVEDGKGKRVGEITDVVLDLEANLATGVILRYEGRGLGEEVAVAFTDGQVRPATSAPDKPRRPHRQNYGGDGDSAPRLAFVTSRELLDAADAHAPSKTPVLTAVPVSELLGDGLVRHGGGSLGKVENLLVEADGRLAYVALDEPGTRRVAWEYIQVDMEEDEVRVSPEAPIEDDDRAGAR
jgi:sporulation protein YlmC with PRC-barrel domain